MLRDRTSQVCPHPIPPARAREEAQSRNFQFLVTVVERFETLAEVDALRHCRTQRRAGAIGADQHRCRVLARDAGLVAKLQCGLIPVDGRKPLVEMDARAGRFGRVEQRHVQAAAIDRPDHFGIVATVAEQFGMAVQMVHHAPAHHDRKRRDALLQPGDAQPVPAAFGEGEIDRAAAEESRLARVRPAFERLDLEAALREQRRQQGADQASTDQGDLVASHRRSMPELASAVIFRARRLTP